VSARTVIAATSPQLPAAGERLAERYTIIKQVSLGGFGAVYKAVQDTLGREVAIKILLPEIFANRDYVEQFRQEALLTSQLRHPNTITVFDYGQTPSGLLFLVMEWLDGKTLGQGLREDGALSYERCYSISHQILKSLSEAHDRGMVHRDLKPSNLFLCEQYGETDFVKVLDFGLVKNLSTDILPSLQGGPIDAPNFTEKRRAPGTPHYMAPEQATGKGTTTASDIYSFGLILYEMLTGNRAFDGADKMQVLLKQARDPVPPLPPELQATFLGKIVKLCVQKNPTKRPQKAAELVKTYQRVEDTGGVEVHTTEIRTTDSWRAMAEPRSLTSEISSSPSEEIVGRDNEVAAFDALLRRSNADGVGALMSISGELGLGKTALLNRLSALFIERFGGRVLRTSFSPFSLMPLNGWRAALRELLGLRPHEVNDVRHQVRQALDGLGVKDIYLLNFLSGFLFGSFGARDDQLEECRQRIESLLSILSQQRGGLLVLFDNAQWADTHSLQMISALATSDALRGQPIHWLWAARTPTSAANPSATTTGGFDKADGAHPGRVEQPELIALCDTASKQGARFHDLKLGPLPKRASLQIIERAIDMQRDMAQRCLTLSRGNPLWLQLVLRYLIDEAEHISRQLSKAADPSTIDPAAARLYLPNSLDKIALRRVDQVVRKYAQEVFREVLRRAALLGEAFLPAVLERVLRRERLYEMLDRTPWALELWRREGILRRGVEGADVLEFIHPHLIEYFTSEAEPQLHLHIAQAKEDAARDVEDYQVPPAELARHFRAANETAMAVRCFDAAAQSALKSNLYASARDLYQEMLPLLGQGSAQDITIRKQTFLALGEISQRLHEIGPSSDYFKSVLSLGQADNDTRTQGLALCGQAELSLIQGQFDDATRMFYRARAMLNEADHLAYGRVLIGMGRVFARSGDWTKSRSCFESAQRLGNDHRNYALVAQALQRLGHLDLGMGLTPSAHERFGQALEFYRAVQQSDHEADALLDLAFTTLQYRQVSEAFTYTHQALTIRQRQADAPGIARAQLALAEIELDQLNLLEAQALINRALPTFKNLGDTQGLARAHALMAHTHRLRGQTSPSRRLAQGALPFFEESGDLWHQLHLQNLISFIDLCANDTTRAAERLATTLTLLDVHGSDVHRAAALDLSALLHCLRGDLLQAASSYHAAYEVGQRALQVPAQFFARLGLFKVGLLQQGGRWYLDELWQLIRTAQSYSLPAVSLRLLASLSWFEGVFGDQAGWEAAISELRLGLSGIPVAVSAVQLPFELDIQSALPHIAADALPAFSRSADWVRQVFAEIQAASPISQA
jgi:serine/threonine protein kinase/tetratricopeptide (TPR) repeat protein